MFLIVNIAVYRIYIYILFIHCILYIVFLKGVNIKYILYTVTSLKKGAIVVVYVMYKTHAATLL